MKRCVIIMPLYAGERRAEVAPRTGDLLLCADGGYDRAVACGWKPDLVIGDFDSMPENHVKDCPVRRVPTHKDDTDTALCLAEGRARGYDTFLLCGGIGGRMDHTMANLQTLYDCALRGETAILLGGENEARFLQPGRHTLARHMGDKLSLFAWNGDVMGIELTGAAYPLHDATLTPNVPLGVSNEWAEDEVRLSFRTGTLLMVASRDAV